VEPVDEAAKQRRLSVPLLEMSTLPGVTLSVGEGDVLFGYRWRSARLWGVLQTQQATRRSDLGCLSSIEEESGSHDRQHQPVKPEEEEPEEYVFEKFPQRIPFWSGPADCVQETLTILKP